MKRICPALLVIALLTLGVGTRVFARSSSPTSPAHIVLLAKDVGSHFQLLSEHHTTSSYNFNQQGLSKADLKRDDYESGYETELQYIGSGSNTVLRSILGVFYVDDAVSVFKSASGAKSAFSVSLRSILKTSAFKKYRKKSFGSFGNETHGYVYDGQSGSLHLTIDLLIFRHGLYTVYLAASGRTSTRSLLDGQFTHLAKVIVHRISSRPSRFAFGLDGAQSLGH